MLLQDRDVVVAQAEAGPRVDVVGVVGPVVVHVMAERGHEQCEHVQQRQRVLQRLLHRHHLERVLEHMGRVVVVVERRLVVHAQNLLHETFEGGAGDEELCGNVKTLKGEDHEIDELHHIVTQHIEVPVQQGHPFLTQLIHVKLVVHFPVHDNKWRAGLHFTVEVRACAAGSFNVEVHEPILHRVLVLASCKLVLLTLAACLFQDTKVADHLQRLAVISTGFTVGDRALENVACLRLTYLWRWVLIGVAFRFLARPRVAAITLRQPAPFLRDCPCQCTTARVN
mmetsp:Transcript_31007/g.52073  ORF Transcript_31007/g.52073 Transcript_31007/m.52073 type:complete len:283 (-) Transcript_31007:1747-2595(-)